MCGDREDQRIRTDEFAEKQQQLTATISKNCISVRDLLIQTLVPTAKEIEKAVLTLKKNKAARPDDFTTGALKTAIVVKIPPCIIKEIWNCENTTGSWNGILPEKRNHTLCSSCNIAKFVSLYIYSHLAGWNL